MVLILLLFALGVLLSAFFSGSETGFYRVTRIKLVLDGLEGKFLAKFLLFLTNHPALFVATTLIGNNTANYITSLAVVLFTQQFYTNSSAAELILPALIAPFLFVYGELLPKSLFFHMPNRLLRYGSPLFCLFTILFAPIAVLLWLFGQVLQWLLGESPTQVRLKLARKELEDVLVEGSEAGILNASQSRLAQGLFLNANKTVDTMAIPLARMKTIKLKSKIEDALQIAKHNKLSVLTVIGENRKPLGYVRVCDLRLESNGVVTNFHKFIELPAKQSIVSSILKMQSKQQAMALVTYANKSSVSVVNLQQLIEPIVS